MSQRFYFRDAPDPQTDTLERRQFAERAVRALREVRRQSESSVAGLIAPWGAGKSTALSMIVEGLKEHDPDPWIVVDLNPWLYSDVDSLQLGFFVALREALPSGNKWKRSREHVGNFFTAISPAGKVNGLVGVDASSALEALGKKIAGDTSANALKEKAEEALKGLEKPILFVMDDLDRLTPDELLMVFKLVRLVGRLPNVYYLLAYDEKTLLDLVQQTNIASGNRTRARDYMEKIIQVRLDVPAMRPEQKAELINSAMAEVMGRYEIEVSEEDNELFSRAYRGYMSNTLTTPRAINRYFAQIDALYETLNKEVNFIDFSLITFIRTFEPEVYKNLTGPWRAEIMGELQAYIKIRKEGAAEREARWHELLLSAHVNPSDLSGLYELLTSLFPNLRPELSSSQVREVTAQRRGIGDRDYFERYFAFGVPGGDIPDTALENLIQGMNESPDAEGIRAILVALKSNTARACRKLRRCLPGNREAAAQLLPHLADIYASTLHEFFSVDGSPMINLEQTAQLALSEIAVEKVEDTINAMNAFPFGAILASNAVQRLKEEASSNFDTLLLYTSRVLEERVGKLLTRDLATVSTHDFRHVFHWRAIAGKGVTDPRLKSALVDGPWTALDFAARNISVATSGQVETLADLSFEILDEVIGLEYFYRELADAIDATDEPVLRHHYSDTIDNRRLLALSFLRHRRDNAPHMPGND
ncbi:KAP family P-loop NTPase fold protein [Streptomyces sp. BBFR109]|uniref:KAP family P-loop NTPase fold protein n=1 Tax=Streptomyces sp. BBFR109 TaxID=3448172 RepID=UPI003F76606B